MISVRLQCPNSEEWSGPVSPVEQACDQGWAVISAAADTSLTRGNIPTSDQPTT